VASLEGVEDLGKDPLWVHRMKCSGVSAFAAWRADGIDDPGFVLQGFLGSDVMGVGMWRWLWRLICRWRGRARRARPSALGLLFGSIMQALLPRRTCRK